MRLEWQRCQVTDSSLPLSRTQMKWKADRTNHSRESTRTGSFNHIRNVDEGKRWAENQIGHENTVNEILTETFSPADFPATLHSTMKQTMTITKTTTRTCFAKFSQEITSLIRRTGTKSLTQVIYQHQEKLSQVEHFFFLPLVQASCHWFAAKSLVARLMEVDQDQRLTAQEAINHEWYWCLSLLLPFPPCHVLFRVYDVLLRCTFFFLLQVINMI